MPFPVERKNEGLTIWTDAIAVAIARHAALGILHYPAHLVKTQGIFAYIQKPINAYPSQKGETMEKKRV